MDVIQIHKIGPYLFGRKLGEGAFAVVREATHLVTGQKVAVKLFNKHQINDDYVQATLHREAKLLRRTRHPNIIKLLEVVETDDHLILVTEKAATDLLSHICDGSVLSEAKARQCFRELISAIAHLHKLNIVHRDLKTENMLLDEFGRLKLIDFGLSNDMTGKEFLETACGSMAYSAPELLGRKPYGKPVDIWSMGVCLFVMLTGKLPFKTDGNLTAQHALMLDGQYDLPDFMSAELKKLLISMFQVKPTKRATLEQLCNDEWVMGDDGPQLHLLDVATPLSKSTIQDHVLKRMHNMGFEEYDVIEAVLANRLDRACATYHLLADAEQRIRERQRQLELEQEQELESEQMPRSASFNARRDSQRRSRRGSTDASPRRPSFSSVNASPTRPTTAASNSTLRAALQNSSPTRGTSGRRLSERRSSERITRRPSMSGMSDAAAGRRGSFGGVASMPPRRQQSESTLQATRLEDEARTSRRKRLSSESSCPSPHEFIQLDEREEKFRKAVGAMMSVCDENDIVSPGVQDSLEELVHEALRNSDSRKMYDFAHSLGWNGIDFGLLDFDCLPSLATRLRDLFPDIEGSSPIAETVSPYNSRPASPPQIGRPRTASRSGNGLGVTVVESLTPLSEASALTRSRSGSGRWASTSRGPNGIEASPRLRRSTSTPIDASGPGLLPSLKRPSTRAGASRAGGPP